MAVLIAFHTYVNCSQSVYCCPYHTKTVAPHVSPAPNPAKLFFTFTYHTMFIDIINKIGTLAAEILPHSSRLVGNFSIG